MSIDRPDIRLSRPVKVAELRQLVAASALGVIISHRDGQISEANDAFLAMIGYSRQELLAGDVNWRRLTPAEWTASDERAVADMDDRGIVSPYAKEYIHKDGHRVPISVGGVRLAGSAHQKICYILDLSAIRRTGADLLDAQRQAQSAEQRSRLLAEQLPHIVTFADERGRLVYVNRICEQYTGLTLGDSGGNWEQFVHPDDRERFERARASGDSYDIEYRLRRAADGKYRWHAGWSCRMPGNDCWLSTAVDIDERKRAEEHLKFVESGGEILARSLDRETTLGRLLELVVPRFGDWASVTLREPDGTVRTVAARHRDTEKQKLVDRLVGRRWARDAAHIGLRAAYETGRPQLLANRRREDLTIAAEPADLPIVEELGYRSTLILPMTANGSVTGTLRVVSSDDGERYSMADIAPLHDLAQRAGTALENARLYERERRVAATLQQASLPRRLPEIAGMRFDAEYRAANEEALIGGDWFDAFTVSDGRIVISVGDVAGNGLTAAALMGNVRQLLRGAAHLLADPQQMLDAADRTLRGDEAQSMVTAFVGVIDPLRKTMLYASAGHVPPMVRDRSGGIVHLHLPGPPLGCRHLATDEEHEMRLEAGSQLLLFTDGLVEWSRDAVAGSAILAAEFAKLAPGRPAKALLDAVLGAAAPIDDVAILLVGIE